MWIFDSQAKINFNNNNLAPAFPTLTSKLTAKTALYQGLGDLLQTCYRNWGKWYHCYLFDSLFQAFSRRAQCSDCGEHVKSYAEETRESLTHFFPFYFSTALYYLNAWNRLSLRQRGFCCIYSLIQTYIWNKCGETDLKYIEMLRKKIFSVLYTPLPWC